MRSLFYIFMSLHFLVTFSLTLATVVYIVAVIESQESTLTKVSAVLLALYAIPSWQFLGYLVAKYASGGLNDDGGK